MLQIDAEFDGLAKYFQEAPEKTRTAARMAINQVAERQAMKLLRTSITREVSFPAGYLNADRLRLRKAYNENLEAVITARARPTSLARFATGSPPVAGIRRGGVTVQVQPGSRRFMAGAFLMRLRAGASIGDNNFNIGLAIRLKPGERIRNKRVMSQLGHNLYLLYGPSVDQVFRSVAQEHAPEIARLVKDEFFRQFARME